MPYPSIEPIFAAWLADRRDIAVVEQLPTNLTFALPLIAVERLSGADATLTLDDATLDVDVFASSRDAARNISEQIREDVRLHLTGYTTGRLSVSRTATVQAPVPRPWGNDAVWRFSGTYRIVAHVRP